MSRFARGSFRPESFCPGLICQWVVSLLFGGLVYIIIRFSGLSYDILSADVCVEGGGGCVCMGVGVGVWRIHTAEKPYLDLRNM